MYLKGGSPADRLDQTDVERRIIHEGERGQEKIGNQQSDHVQMGCETHTVNELLDICYCH